MTRPFLPCVSPFRNTGLMLASCSSVPDHNSSKTVMSEMSKTSTWKHQIHGLWWISKVIGLAKSSTVCSSKYSDGTVIEVFIMPFWGSCCIVFSVACKRDKGFVSVQRYSQHNIQWLAIWIIMVGIIGKEFKAKWSLIIDVNIYCKWLSTVTYRRCMPLQ